MIEIKTIPLCDAVRMALDELGVPDESYPVPIANAVELLHAGLQCTGSESPVMQATEIEATSAKVQALVDAAQSTHDILLNTPELNMGNHDDVEVGRLNDAVIEVMPILTNALVPFQQEENDNATQ